MENGGIRSDRRYLQNQGNDALWDFLRFLDKNNNRIITASEIEGLIVKVCGYSWGGISAIGFSQKLSMTGTIVVGGTPRNPIAYDLRVIIPINLVLTTDPVPILNSPGTVPSNVQRFVNRYQARGGNAIFRYPDSSIAIGDYGSTLSRLLKGTSTQSNAQATDQKRVDTLSPVETRKGVPFSVGQFAGQELWLRSNEVNHDVMPWHVMPDSITLLND